MLVQAWERLIQTTGNEVLKSDTETARRGVESEAMRLSGDPEVKPWGTMRSAGAEGCRRKGRPLGMHTGSLGWATAKDAMPKKARLPQACGQEAIATRFSCLAQGQVPSFSCRKSS